MKKDLDGHRVGVDGNGDGRRGTDIGAYEAKAKGHRNGGGRHHLAHHGGKNHHHGAKHHHHGTKHHHHGGRHHHHARLT